MKCWLNLMMKRRQHAAGNSSSALALLGRNFPPSFTISVQLKPLNRCPANPQAEIHLGQVGIVQSVTSLGQWPKPPEQLLLVWGSWQGGSRYLLCAQNKHFRAEVCSRGCSHPASPGSQRWQRQGREMKDKCFL